MNKITQNINYKYLYGVLFCFALIYIQFFVVNNNDYNTPEGQSKNVINSFIAYSIAISLFGFYIVYYIKRRVNLKLFHKKSKFAYFKKKKLPFLFEIPLIKYGNVGPEICYPFRNIFIGKYKNRPVMILDYKPVLYGDSYHTLFCFRTLKDFPEFQLQPVEFSDNILKIFNKKMFLRFDDIPEFDKKFRLKSNDEIKTKLFFTYKIRKYLVDNNNKWSVEVFRKEIIFYKRRKGLLNPKKYSDYVNEVYPLLNVLES